MKFLRRIAVLSTVALLCAATLEFTSAVGGFRDIGFVSKAQARVGRPLTPVSVAGVGRRTVRRCAAGVYYC